MIKTANAIPGYWYSSGDGHLIQVRAKRLDKGELVLIVTEDMENTKMFLTPAQWIELGLILHSPVDTQQTA